MSKFIQNNLKPIIKDTTNARIGVITLSTDFTIEQDFRKICHNLPVDIFFNRIPFINPLNHENYLKMADHIPEVSEQILPGQKIDVIAYGCTSGTIAIGEDNVSNQVKKSKPESKVTTPITAAIKAFKKLNLKNIAVLTPYPKDVNETVFDYLSKNQLTVDSFNSFNLNYDSEIAKVTPDSLIQTISSIDLAEIDCLFVSCTALKILDLIEDLEENLKTNIISSNQAIIWDSLRLSKTNNKIDRFGKLFKLH